MPHPAIPVRLKLMTKAELSAQMDQLRLGWMDLHKDPGAFDILIDHSKRVLRERTRPDYLQQWEIDLAQLSVASHCARTNCQGGNPWCHHELIDIEPVIWMAPDLHQPTESKRPDSGVFGYVNGPSVHAPTELKFIGVEHVATDLELARNRADISKSGRDRVAAHRKRMADEDASKNTAPTERKWVPPTELEFHGNVHVMTNLDMPKFWSEDMRVVDEADAHETASHNQNEASSYFGGEFDLQHALDRAVTSSDAAFELMHAFDYHDPPADEREMTQEEAIADGMPELEQVPTGRMEPDQEWLEIEAIKAMRDRADELAAAKAATELRAPSQWASLASATKEMECCMCGNDLEDMDHNDCLEEHKTRAVTAAAEAVMFPPPATNSKTDEKKKGEVPPHYMTQPNFMRNYINRSSERPLYLRTPRQHGKTTAVVQLAFDQHGLVIVIVPHSRQRRDLNNLLKSEENRSGRRVEGPERRILVVESDENGSVSKQLTKWIQDATLVIIDEPEYWDEEFAQVVLPMLEMRSGEVVALGGKWGGSSNPNHKTAMAVATHARLIMLLANVYDCTPAGGGTFTMTKPTTLDHTGRVIGSFGSVEHNADIQKFLADVRLDRPTIFTAIAPTPSIEVEWDAHAFGEQKDAAATLPESAPSVLVTSSFDPTKTQLRRHGAGFMYPPIPPTAVANALKVSRDREDERAAAAPERPDDHPVTLRRNLEELKSMGFLRIPVDAAIGGIQARHARLDAPTPSPPS